MASCESAPGLTAPLGGDAVTADELWSVHVPATELKSPARYHSVGATPPGPTVVVDAWARAATNDKKTTRQTSHAAAGPPALRTRGPALRAAGFGLGPGIRAKWPPIRSKANASWLSSSAALPGTFMSPALASKERALLFHLDHEGDGAAGVRCERCDRVGEFRRTGGRSAAVASERSAIRINRRRV